MQGEIEILQVEKKIRTRVKKQMEKTQKEYYLNEQMQAIQKELGERDEFKNEIQELEEKIKNKKMSKEAHTKVRKELKKLKMMSPMSAEATVVRNYIDWVLSLPWEDKTQDKLDINEAEKILDDEHYGLKKVKERILEYLAVQALVHKLKGPILCLVGPPGVGKTSLAKSIAHATGRQLRAPVARRRARRGRDPRPPPHVHRRAARQDHPVAEEGRLEQPGVPARRDRQDVDRLPRRPVGGAARGARSRAEHDVQRSLPRSRLRPVATSCSSRRRTRCTRSRCRCRIAWRSSSSPATPSGRRSSIAEQYLIPKEKEQNGVDDVDVEFAEAGDPHHHPPLHEGSRRP